MNKLAILIIEDQPDIAQSLHDCLTDNDYHVVGIATTYKEAVSLFFSQTIDLVLIDIFLGNNPEGLAFAETIATIPNAEKPFVFLTSSKDRSIFERAKLSKPFRFLLKPFNELELLYTLEMAIEKFYYQNNVFAGGLENTVIGSNHLFIKKHKSLKKVALTAIIYIEVENRYCTLVTETDTFVIQISLQKINEYLPENFLQQVHRKFIVNTQKITQIIPSTHTLVLANEHRIAFSDSYKHLINNFTILK
ncbi:LytTR family transcriptional regulator [Tenacibaculum litopenaei]|jgi:DNA-binding LytR/AlgR family response regulator|uniref:LytR/AlgR family response regulator transcription factor n=1 Tax=Tenacibaculum litopenaei TaxID=396016 RepID=UPI003895330A